MNIGLFDVDGKSYPNLVLMKLSAWHKSKGDDVEIGFPLSAYDKAYCSKVFTFSHDLDFTPLANEIQFGGTGYNLTSKLPNEVEHMMPDYSLYGIKEKAFGFLTRGCPRKCGFCIVSEKEGCRSYQVADLNEFWTDEKEIELLDPNLLACTDHLKLINQLSESKAWVNFSQGLDSRLLNDDNLEALKSVKTKRVHFAADSMTGFDEICKQIKRYREVTGLHYKKIGVYVLTNFDTTEEEDFERIYRLREFCEPYMMIYDKDKASSRLKQIQRWCNNKSIFRSGTCDTFEEYYKGSSEYERKQGIRTEIGE